MVHCRLREVAPLVWTRLGLIAAGLVLAGGSAEAKLIITAPTGVTAVQGTNDPVNYFDVLLTADNSSPTGPFAVNGFNVELRVSVASGVTFSRATTSTAAPYLFASISTLGFDFTLSGGGTIIDFSDFGASQTDVQSVAQGATFGLGRVYFDVSASAPPSPPEVALIVDSVSDVVDSDGTSFLPALSDGSIQIKPAVSAVPEPSTFMLLGFAVFLGRCGAILRGRGRS